MKKKSKTLEDLRAEIIDMIAHYGSDYKAADALAELCEGFGPDRSTLTRIRKGEAKPTMIGMTAALLQIAIKQQKL